MKWGWWRAWEWKMPKIIRDQNWPSQKILQLLPSPSSATYSPLKGRPPFLLARYLSCFFSPGYLGVRSRRRISGCITLEMHSFRHYQRWMLTFFLKISAMGKDKIHVNVVGEYISTVVFWQLVDLACSYWSCRLRKIDHHWSLDLQVRWYRQAYHRKVREGSRRTRKGFLQVRSVRS